MAPPKTTNETEVEDIEVVNFEPQDEEGMDIDGGSVGAEVSAPNPNNKSRSLCSGKVLAGGIIVASAFVMTGLAVDNSAKSEFIQAHQSESTWAWGTTKASKGEGPGPGGKASKGGGPPPPPCEDMVGRCFASSVCSDGDYPTRSRILSRILPEDDDDCLCSSWTTIDTLIQEPIDCHESMPGDACCYSLRLVWDDIGYIGMPFDLSGYLLNGKLHFQGCDDGGYGVGVDSSVYSLSGAYDIYDGVYSLTKTNSDGDYVFYGEDMMFDYDGNCPWVPGDEDA